MVFLALALVAARKHAAQMRGQLATTNFPAVSILKPVHGLEPRLRENLESFFQEEYAGEWELLLCARHEGYAALRLVREISAQYPQAKVRILTSGEPTWPNAKVFS